jgi:DNA-binding beta-propeller fold protein YncE
MSILRPGGNPRLAALAGAFLLAAAVAGSQETSQITLKAFPASCEARVDGVLLRPASAEGIRMLRLPHGAHAVTLSCPGYIPQSFSIDIPAQGPLIERKLERIFTYLWKTGELHTGSQPKSAAFTPDGRFIVSALLDGEGAEVFSAATLSKVTTLSPPAALARQKGFVEIAIPPGRDEIWVSQMTTAKVHVFSLSEFRYLSSISTDGVWSKVIAFSPDGRTGVVSNWCSHDVSFIDTAARVLVARVRVAGVPRGMAFSRDGRFLYVGLYENVGGYIVKIDASTRKVVKSLWFGGAMRHIVLHPSRDLLYVSDMAGKRVLVIDAAKDSLAFAVPVADMPNTIALTPDGSYLFVSCRGPNNPQDYTKKGPEFGKLVCIDTSKNKVVDWAWGTNQPTGLSVSPDCGTIVLTDFLDKRAEVFRFTPGGLLPPKPAVWKLPMP